MRFDFNGFWEGLLHRQLIAVMVCLGISVLYMIGDLIVSLIRVWRSGR